MGMYLANVQAIAGPFLPNELVHNIPVDKKLDPNWIASLYKRGTATKYYQSKNELQYIGMPVGGIHTGTVYLGGDGRLWLWDIFNENQTGINPVTIDWHSDLHVGKKVRPSDGAAYVQPAKNIRPLDQGFAFYIKTGSSAVIKKMEAADWDEIIFEATYPMAKIHYIDRQIGITIIATVYAPFIPLDEKNSSLPTTIYSFEVVNKLSKKVEVTILGWLENKIGIKSAKSAHERSNSMIKHDHLTGIEYALTNSADIAHAPDFGTMSIATTEKATIQTDLRFPLDIHSFESENNTPTVKNIATPLYGSCATKLTVLPHQTASANFVFGWHFSNLKLNNLIKDTGRNYNNWFKNAAEVAAYVCTNLQQLKAKSLLWHNTLYDSSLPWWFIERTFLTISVLATTTAHRFESGRFYAWEGVGCCEGTCTHVWQYAQAMGRIFPGIEKDTRERIDLGLSLQPDGMIWYRGEVVKGPAIDGQAGTILRIYREHQMSVDDSFLKNNWTKIKKAIEYIILQDKNKDGMEDTPIENTLDAVWDGSIAWLVGLCIAAVKAGALMANEMHDTAFENICNEYVQKGSKNMEEQLFNGEYFIHQPDPQKGREKLGSYNTCHIDQVFGQSWAHQVGMGRIIDQEKTISALKALWKYNFTPDVGPYIKERKGGRPYALPGEGGLVMNTNPKNEQKPYGENVTWQLGYFHECMTGFEHQVAAHMMAEGMVEESLIITRMIHDRYHAVKRNPFNEIECSDHYARSMASYGTFISACGYEYHGPKQYIGFAPKINAEKFKAPFTSANGWGSYAQTKTQEQFHATIHLKYGTLLIKKISVASGINKKVVKVEVGGKNMSCTTQLINNKTIIEFPQTIELTANQQLHINI